MSVSYTDCLSDLLCSEDSGDALTSVESPAVSSSSPFDFPASFDDDGESISKFIESERSSFVSFSGADSSLDSSSRSLSVSWILKVRAFYGFQPVTAYLAVNYLDRFLSCHHLLKRCGWPLQLLSVACLSLAAKMEEPLVPSLLDLQVEGVKFVFEPKTVQRMELLILSVLDWRLRCITPFTFITFFACKLDAIGTCTAFLVARSTDLILSNIREASSLEYWPSSIAAAAILCAASEIPSLSFATPEHVESWCDGLSKDKVSNCYKLMQQFVEDSSRRKSIKVIPQFRVTAQVTRTRSTHCHSPSSSSSTSLSVPSPFNSNINNNNNNNNYYHNFKRRRLNNNSWVDDDNYGN